MTSLKRSLNILSRQGFSLVEFLILLIIVAIIVGLLPPAINKFRDSAKRAQCTNQMKQLGAAVIVYTGANDAVPYGLLRDQPGKGGNEGFPHPDRVAGKAPPFQRYSLMHQLLPFIGQEEMWKSWNPADFNSNKNSGFMRKVVPLLVCPANANAQEPLNTFSKPNALEIYFVTSYLGSAGTRSYPRWVLPPDTRPNLRQYMNGFFQQNTRAKPADFTDGLGTTLMLGERFYFDPVFDTETESNIGNWGWCWFGAQCDAFLGTSSPVNFQLPKDFKTLSPGRKQRLFDDRINSFGSGHEGGACFVLGDGSVRFIHENISQITLEALGTRAGREDIEDF